MGSQVETTLSPTAAFAAGADKPIVKLKAQCPFCKGPHSPSLCTTVTDCKQRTDIIRQDRMCFNSLGHHKISCCNSVTTAVINIIQAFVLLDTRTTTTHLPPQSTLYSSRAIAQLSLHPLFNCFRDLSIYWNTSYKLCSTSTHSSASTCCSTY